MPYINTMLQKCCEIPNVCRHLKVVANVGRWELKRDRLNMDFNWKPGKNCVLNCSRFSFFAFVYFRYVGWLLLLLFKGSFKNKVR